MRTLSLARLPRLLLPSLRALLAHRTRSLLAASGVAVGVAALVLVSAIGAGAQRELTAGLTAQGTRLLVVRPAQVKRLVARKEVRGRVATLTPADAEALATLAAVDAVAPAVDGLRLVRSEAGTSRGLVVGTTSTFLEVRGFRLARGSFFSADDDEDAARVVVLGARVSATLFPAGEPVGAVVRIATVPFEVVGVLEAQGVTADGADVDTQLYIPLRTALRRTFNTRALGSVFVRVREEAALARTEADLGAVLRERHRLDERGRPDDFAVQNPARALAARRQVTRVMTLFTSSIAAISLLVGGTGILALMLLSVRERTAEIGLRRAVGAWPLDILVQFLAEAVTLSLGGGVAGVGLGVLGAWATAATTGWPVSVTVVSATVGVGVSAALGLVFGVWPASQAARLAPVVALSRA